MRSCLWLTVLATIFGSDRLAQQSSAAEEEHRDLVQALSHSPHRILFEAYDHDNWDLFVMNADGSEKQNLTGTKELHELYPQASPDGSKICFLVDEQTNGDTLRCVYVMSADGSGRKLIATKARQPCWSPDGKRIAFVKQEFRRFRVDDYVSKGLFIHDLDSGETKELANRSIEHLYNLTWSRDGEWIVSTVHGGMGFGHAIVAIEIDGERVIDLKIPGCRPCLSPQGDRITWSSDDHTVNVAKIDFVPEPRVSNVRVVDKHASLHLYHPDFSPDGQFVTYSVGPGGRMPQQGPGTHSHVAEIVGVRGKWNLCLRRVTEDGGVGAPVMLTDDESMSNEESEWIRGE